MRRPLAALVVLSVLGAGCARPNEHVEPLRLSGEVFGTTWSVVFVPSRGSHVDDAEVRAAIESSLRRVDALMSSFRPDSDVSRFNAIQDESPVDVDAETAKVVAAALRFARETKGAFDPTVAPLVRLWGFGAGAADEEPSEEEISVALEKVGHTLVYLDASGRLARKVSGVRLDLSGIAKGHGVDAVVEGLSPLRPAGLMVEIGGDLRVTGVRGDGEPWRLGVWDPRGGLHGVLRVTSGALATSGDYRQRRGEGEDRVTHVVDPRSGRPVPTNVASVSVLAPTALEADALATALMVMGPEEGLVHVEERPWIEALLLLRDSEGEEIEARASSGWALRGDQR